MCTNFRVDILKNDRVLVFWRSKMAIFHAVPCDFCTFPTFNICQIWAVQKVFYGHFSCSWQKKLTQKDVSRRPNLKFSVWPFLDLVTLNDLDLEYTHRKPRTIPRNVPDTIHVVVLAYFHLIRFVCATKPDAPNRQTFWLWPDQWRHRWPRGQQN